MGRHLSPRYGQVILVSGYPVLTAVNWWEHWCAISVLLGYQSSGKCESKHWYACGADRRSVGHVITKFSGMGRFIYPWCSSGALRARSSAKTYSAFSFDRINFFNMANLFLLSQEAFVMCNCFRAPIKNFLSWRLSNDCQIVRPALVSSPPNRKKPYNKHLISLFFSVRTANYGPSFFSIDLWPVRFALGP